MKRTTRTVTSIGIVALVIGLVAAGISTFSNAGYNPILVFVAFAVLVLVVGLVLDAAARNALSNGPKR